MPPLAGETTFLTLFVDIHYFLSAQNHKPLHHRFEKGSYLYIHLNATNGRGRIEVANNAGTPDQDAFAGALENAHIAYSYKKPTFVSVNLLPLATQAPQKPWQIPAFDPQNQNKYMYPISSIDLYLWNAEDALDLIEAFGEIESIGALSVERQSEEHDSHQDTLNPIVQQLEQAAIGPPYKKDSTSTIQSYPGPPSTAASTTTQTSSEAAMTSAPAPMAYNPAAPAAPESRVHREKTPPPIDADVPIAAAVAGGYQPMASYQPLGAGNPYQPRAFQPPLYNVSPQQQQQQQQHAQTAAISQTSSYQPGLYSPPSQQQSNPSAPAGYSTYSYATHQQPIQPAYNIHQQVYRPTESEVGKIHPSQMPAAQLPGQTQQAALSGKGSRVEKGVNRFLQRLDKKF